MGFSGGSNDNEHAFRDLSLIPGLGISHGEREWQPTLVFLPREFHGQMSLAGYSPWDRKESDRIEQLTFFFYSSPHFLCLHWYSALSLPLGIVGDLPSPYKRKSELTWSEPVS